jgi:peptidoglycan/LPS O-acetylase OafA/YrhL
MFVFNRIKIQRKIRIFLWILSGFIGIYSMFSVTFYYSPTYEYSRLEAALYNCLHRIGWNIFISWLIISCVNNPNGSLRKLLSSRALVPLSRLTYCAYLTNGFIELYLSSSIRSPKYLSVISLVITQLFL